MISKFRVFQVNLEKWYLQEMYKGNITMISGTLKIQKMTLKTKNESRFLELFPISSGFFGNPFLPADL